MADGRLYDYTNQREKGERHNLYWNNVSTQVTEAELKELFNAEDNLQLRKAFGSFDNYLAYMNERQDLIDSGELKADWWDTGVALVDQGMMSEFEGDMDDRALEQSIINRGVELATDAYAAQSPVLNALYEKYTGSEGGVWYNSDGDKFRWNGTSFVKTVKVDDSFNVNNFILATAAAGIAGVVAAPLAASIGSSMGASLGLSQTATQALVNGLTNGLATAGSTLIRGGELTGDILADVLWGTLSPTVINQLGLTPETFASAFVDSLGSDAVSNLITGQDFDWKDMLESAALSGGITSVKDFVYDWLSTKDKEDLYQHYLQEDYERFGAMSPEEFDEFLLNDPTSLLNTSDVGALLGPEGLLTKVFGFEGTSDYASTEWFDSGVNTVLDFLGSMGVDKALAAISSVFPEGEEDPFYGKGTPYQWDEAQGIWVLDRNEKIMDEFGNIVDNPNYWTDEEIDRWNEEFLYGGDLDERYWHSWQERDPNSTVQGIWENPMTPETGGLGGLFGSLIGTGGGLKIADSALPGAGVADPDGAWERLIDTWNDFVDDKSPEEQLSWAEENGFDFSDDPISYEDPFVEDETDLLTDSVTDEEFIQDPFNFPPDLYPPELPEDEIPPEFTEDDVPPELPPEFTEEDLPPELPPEGDSDQPPEGDGGGGLPPTPKKKPSMSASFSPAQPRGFSAGVVGNFPLVGRQEFPIENFLAQYYASLQQPQLPTQGAGIVESLFEGYI